MKASLVIRVGGTRTDTLVPLPLQYGKGEYHVETAETAGLDYYRPDYTEPISSEYAATLDDPDAASEKVEEFLRDLS